MQKKCFLIISFFLFLVLIPVANSQAVSLTACSPVTKDSILDADLTPPTEVELTHERLPVGTCLIIEADGVILDCQGHSITGSDFGIYMTERSNVIVKNCVLQGNSHGIYFRNSVNITMQNNIVNSNSYGIYIGYNATNNAIVNNIINSNSDGIKLYVSDYNTIQNNTINSNTEYGIILDGARYNTIKNNIVNKNKEHGIVLFPVSDYNYIINNIVNSNAGLGISLIGSSENTTVSNNVVCNNSLNLSLTAFANGDIYCFNNPGESGSGNTADKVNCEGLTDTKPCVLNVKEGQLVVLEPRFIPNISSVEWHELKGDKNIPLNMWRAEDIQFSEQFGYYGAFDSILKYTDIKKEDLPQYLPPPNMFSTWAIVRSFSPGDHIIEMRAILNNSEVFTDTITINVEKTAGSEKSVAIILAKFPDKSPSRKGDWRDTDGDGDATDDDGWDSYEYENLIAAQLNNYYEENSYGKIRFNYRIYDNGGQWYTLPKSYEEYCKSWLFPETEIVDKAKELAGVSADVVIVVHAGPSAQTGGGCLKTSANGWPTKDKILVSEFDNVGAWAHELGHYLGLQDRFQYSYAILPNEVDGWSLMSDGASCDGYWHPTHIESYSKKRLGWIGEDLKLTDGEFEITVLPKSDKVLRYNLANILGYAIVPYILLEGRTDNGKWSYWDRTVPASGVAIYTARPSSAFDFFGALEHVGTLRYVGDYYYIPVWDAKFTLTGDHIDSFGEVIVKIESGLLHDITGAVIETGGQVVNGISNGVQNCIGDFTGCVEDVGNGVADAAGATVDWACGGLPDWLCLPPQNRTARPAPDLDLHAYYNTPDNPDIRHVGMNYETGIYETQPDALSSGDLPGEEWIFVPSNANVTYKVTNHDIKEFLEKESWAFNFTNGTENYDIVFMAYDENSTRYISPKETYELNASHSSSRVIFEEENIHIPDPNVMVRLPQEIKVEPDKITVKTDLGKQGEQIKIWTVAPGFVYSEMKTVTKTAEYATKQLPQGKYTLLIQHPGPDGQFYEENLELLNETNGAYKFLAKAKEESDDAFVSQTLATLCNNDGICDQAESYLSCEDCAAPNITASLSFKEAEVTAPPVTFSLPPTITIVAGVVAVITVLIILMKFKGKKEKRCAVCGKQIITAYTCVSCGKDICFDCARKYQENIYCLNCLRKMGL